MEDFIGQLTSMKHHDSEPFIVVTIVTDPPESQVFRFVAHPERCRRLHPNLVGERVYIRAMLALDEVAMDMELRRKLYHATLDGVILEMTVSVVVVGNSPACSDDEADPDDSDS